MARFVPDIASDSIPHDSERLVYDALRGLPDGFTVLHSFPWLRPNRDLASEPLREGEADFVVLSPSLGLLVIEVKGGYPTLNGRTWYRSGKEMRDPFDQASRNRWALLDALKERTKGALNRDVISHGIAVVFPHATYHGPLPLNTDPRILIDAGRLAQMPEMVIRAYNAWPKRAELTVEQFQLMLDALLPKLRLYRYEKADIESDRARIIQITETQQQVLLGLLANKRVLINGVAGSGKTMLAVEFARSLSSNGQRVLLLCFNRYLADYLRTQFENGTGSTHIDVQTFHSLALSLAHRAKVDFEVPDSNAQQFWDNDACLILEQALSVLSTNKVGVFYDSIVVDEAQDFSPEWWLTIEALFGENCERRLYAFLDLKQSWRTAPAEPPVAFDTRFNLDTNCRNTKSIAAPAAKLVSLNTNVLPGSPLGEPPTIRRTRPEAMAGLVKTEIERLVAGGVGPMQIVLIGPAGYKKGSLSKFDDIAGFQLTSDANEWKAGNRILVTTARAFKGLEADVVILYDITGLGDLFSITDLYIAWTRARSRLVLLVASDSARQTIESALAEGIAS